MTEILNSVLRARQRFIAERGKSPRFVALDSASYLRLVHELRTYKGVDMDSGARVTFRGRNLIGDADWNIPASNYPDLHQLKEVAGLEIVVVPGIPELLCVVGEPWEEGDSKTEYQNQWRG